MGSLDTALGSDAAVMCADFGEPWVYTPQPVNGVPQPSVNINPIVDRHRPEAMLESGVMRTRSVSAFIPAVVNGGLPTRPNRGDTLKGPWQVGGTPENFTIVTILSQDPGGWTVRADASSYSG